MSEFLAENGPLVKDLALIVLMMVAIGCALEAFKIWLAHRGTIATAHSTQIAAAAAQESARTQRLEQRIGVLERIATNRGADLAETIERLRDERPLN